VGTRSATPRQRGEALLNVYTGTTYDIFNKQLRGFTKPFLDQYKSFEKLLNRTLDKLPISTYNSTTRPLLRSTYITEYDISNIFVKDKVFSDLGFFSTTHSRIAFEEWLIKNTYHNVMFEVYGKNGKLIEEVSQKFLEREVIFKSQTKFKVLDVDIDYIPIKDSDRLIYKIVLKEI
jgi:hypothetical protein